MRRASPLVCCLLALAAEPARAGDGLRERTPVVHLGETCLTLVDRTTITSVHLDFTFPYEDTCGGPHPPPAFQLFALCRPPEPGELLPQWITRADIDYAIGLGFALPTLGPEQVLEESPAWSGCWTRITADDDRRPLTCESALAGIDWDISATPPGIQVIAAYTFQPPKNLWAPRWGVFAITDDSDTLGPVAAIANREAFVYADEVMTLAACTAAAPGATLRIEYAIDTDAPVWQIAADDIAVDGPTVMIPWDPPASVETENMRLRATIRDLQGRTRTLESPETLAMLGVPSPTGGDADPPEPVPDTCRDDDTPAQYPCPMSDPGSTTGDDTSTGDAPEPAASGCACATHDAPRSPLLLTPLLLLAARRRRRYMHSTAAAASEPIAGATKVE